MTAFQILLGLLFIEYGLDVDISAWWYLMIFAGLSLKGMQDISAIKLALERNGIK